MAGEDFFKFNKGNEFRFSNFREIKEEDLKGADEKTKKLFNIFAGEDKILQEVEAKSLFNVLKSAAGDNQVLEDNEIKAFAKEHIGEEVDTNILATFVNNIFGTKEKPQIQAMQVTKGYAPQKQQTFLEEAACKEIVIDIIDENLSEAYEILNSQYLGSISGWHNERKDKNDILKTSNVSKVLDYQNAGIEWMNKAKLAPPNGLTKKEYYEGNKQRIKDMILTRVLVLDTNTKFKELKNKYSEEKLAQIIGDYVEQLCSNASIEDLKDIQKQFVSYSGVEEIQALENVIDNAIKFNADKNKPMPYSEVPLPKFDNSKGIVPEYWNTDEPISFEEVYKIERGTEYSQYKIEQYALAKKEMEVVANAYNKKQQFIEFAEGLRRDETLSLNEKTQKVLEGFATFYAFAEDGGLSQLQELITKSKLPISIDENGFNFGALDDSAKNRALNSLLKLAQQSKEKEFEEFLNGKTLEEYQIALAQAQNEAIGDENGKMIAEAMKNDNLTCIQRWTGNTSLAGMGMTVVGGILCFTPLAPLGAGMITVGNTLAIGGMVAKTGLGVTDYATKDVQTAEEAEQLTKDFIMDAGGFIIGMGAGKAGLKAFSKLIDKKLVAVFGQQIASGNKMQALKTVFTNPEYLKNFMTAAGAKLSADFVISYAGDLAMMGILDTQDDWQSLLKANLTGILVGMSGDIKDVSGVGRPRNFGVSDGVKGANEASRFDQPTSPHVKKPMTEMDYGQRLLGNDVTVADPKTGATVEGTVTGLYSQNGQVVIEVNGQRFSTNDVAEVKGGAKVETPKVEISLGQRLETASSREEFIAIRNEIKSMPNGAEKTALQQEYLRKWNEFSRKYNEEFDIRMEYKSNESQARLSNILEILNSKEGLKDFSDDIKNKVANLIANSDISNQDEIIKLVDRLKNAKQRWGKNTIEYNAEQILEIISQAANPDGSLNMTALQRICKRMDGGPREDNFQIGIVLPKLVEELRLARDSEGFYDPSLMEISQKLVYAHETRNEIFKLLKDENGNPIKDLVDLVLTDKSENFDDGDMILGVLKSLYTDGKLNLNKVGQMKELVKDGSVSIYRAAHTMQSDMPADIIQNIGVFTQKGLSNNEVTNVINYLKSQNIKPTFDSVKNIIENCGNIPELRDIHVKKLLNQRGESIDKSYYEYVKKIAQHIEQIKQVYPEKANQFPKDIVASYIKLLQIDGRSVQLKQHEIIELLYDRGKDTCPFDIDKLVESGLLSDIPGRDKPLQPRDLMRYQKEDTEVLKKAISRGFLSGNYSKILSLREVPSGVMTLGGGKSKLKQLVELSDSELQFLQSMNTSDMLFGTAVGLAKCNPEQVKFLLETMNTHGSQYFAKNYLRDSNFDLAYKMFKEIDAKMENHTTELTPQIACRILHFVNSENKYDAQNLFDNRQELGISADKIPSMLENKIAKKQIQKAIKVMGKSKVEKLSNSDFVIACQFADLYGKKNINEIPLRNKRDLLRSLVSSNRGLFEISEELSKDFPLLPKNQEEYCSLLPSIVRSLGIETNELTPEQRITMFNSSMGELSKSLSEISDADFAKMTITQEYPKDKFILDVLDKVKALPRTERQKVYDYFGFELHHNKENSTGFSITGYPVNLNNGKKLAQIEDPRTKAVVEDLRPNIVRFSENNKIKCNNPQVERFLNEVIEALPELRTTIGKKQHGVQAFDVMQHSLKVMQKIAQDPKFETLNESDQKIMLLASLMHDIAKAEGSVDKQHANYGSFDSFFIAQKFNLTKEEEVKLHTLIKYHEWLEQVNTAKSEEQLKKRLQSVAYDLQQGNLFDMAEIFTHADLRAVRADDSFHDTTEGRSRVGFDGTVRSFGESANLYAERIRGYINELQKSQPLLPQTKVPRASRINEAITQVNPDGSTNIKGVYKDKDGLVVIKFNEVEDWEGIGFPKGSISHGVEIKKGEKGDAELSENVNTGNIKFFVHGLNYSNQLAKFDAFSLVDSDALLSVSYAERPESKFRFFRPQGVLLDVNSKYIHGGGNTDSGSGCGKDIAEFKKNYIFGGHREFDRLYVSDLIKKTTGMTDEQYVEFVEINKDKPIQEIEPAEIRDKIIKAFATINSNTRKGKREYNEMYISNPNEVMGVFAYSIDYTEKIGNPVEFLNRNTVGEHEEGYGGEGNISVKERTEFLRQYALERDLPFILFGD